MPQDNLNAALLAAMVQPHKSRLEYFQKALQRHIGHVGFRAEAGEGEMGFSCDCEGSQEKYLISTKSLQESLTQVRETYIEMSRRRRIRLAGSPGSKKLKRNRRQAIKKSFSILCKHLTKQQRQELKGTGLFHIQGQDGLTYQVGSRTVHGIKRLGTDGEPTHSFCIVPTDPQIPIYDTILAQKVLLEHNLSTLEHLANVKVLYQKGPLRDLVRGLREEREEPPRKRFSLQDAGRGAPEVFFHDMMVYEHNGEAVYDVDSTIIRTPFLGYVLGVDGHVYPRFDAGRQLLTIPRLEGIDASTGIVTLLMGMPVQMASNVTEVYQYIESLDLHVANAICHPRTIMPKPYPYPYPLFIFDDERIPLGKVYYLPSSEFVALIVHWDDGGVGYGVTNPMSIIALESTYV